MNNKFEFQWIINNLKDDALSSSSDFNRNLPAKACRLNDISGKGNWSAKANDSSQWLQVNLGRIETIVAVAVQGRFNQPQWVSFYNLHISTNLKDWTVFENIKGASDQNTVVEFHLPDTVTGQYIRFVPQEWNVHISMRVDVAIVSQQTKVINEQQSNVSNKTENPNFKRKALNFLHAIRLETEKVCSNRATRPTATDKHGEWRSYINKWEQGTKIWEDLAWRVIYPDANGKSFLVLGAYSNSNKIETENVFKKIFESLIDLCDATWLSIEKERVMVKVPIDATQEDLKLSENFAKVKNLFVSFLPLFVKNMHEKVADIKSLLSVEEKLDYVPNWDENTDQVLVVAGNWGYQIAKKYGIYECQNFRTFRSSKYLAFYDDGKIEEVFEILGKPYDNAISSNTPEILKMSLDMPQFNGNLPRRCFRLKSLGKIGPVINDTLSHSGKTVPFTYGQARYTTIDLIKKAKKTSELIHGLDANIITNTFVNNKSKHAPKVDILWVIDNSGSMEPYQKSMASNFDSFINNFINKPAIEIPDFKMAITTTDEKINGEISDGGGIFSKDWVIDEDLKELVLLTFGSEVKVGTSGSVNEKGLKCAWLALKNNASFFRNDAPLVINIVTDEEDDDNVSVDQYLSQLNSNKNGQRVIINLIGLPGFNRYQYAVNKTNGVYLDIKSDFKSVMKSISLQMVEVSKSFPLSHQPINSSLIKVNVYGKSTTDFIYSASSNTIKPGNSIPADATIEVEYEIAD
jgi:hypothetical protein